MCAEATDGLTDRDDSDDDGEVEWEELQLSITGVFRLGCLEGGGRCKLEV